MNTSRICVAAMLAVVLLAWQGGASAQVITPIDARAAIEQPSGGGGDPLAAIRDAVDPSSAIDAYAKATAAQRENVAVQEAYIQKMVSFGLPEMAERQAQDVTKRDPDSGLAWAVVAYMNAKRNQTPSALIAMAEAVKRSTADPFVQRTGAELVAWYDVRADKTKMPDAAKQAAEDVRGTLSQRQGYLDAYAKAKKDYQRPADEPTAPPAEDGAAQPQAQQSGPAPVGPAEPVAPQPLVPEGYVQPPPLVGEYYSPPVYTDPYAYGVYPAYPAYDYYPAYWYPSFGCSSWWWPSFSLSFWYSDGWRHHRYYGRDWDRRGGRDWRDHYSRDDRRGGDRRDGRGGLDRRDGGGRGGSHNSSAAAAPRGIVDPTRAYSQGRGNNAYVKPSSPVQKAYKAQKSGDAQRAAPKHATAAPRSTIGGQPRVGSATPRYNPSMASQPRPNSGYVAKPNYSTAPRSISVAPRSSAGSIKAAPKSNISIPQSTPSYSAPRPSSSSFAAPRSSISVPRSSTPSYSAPRPSSSSFAAPRSSISIPRSTPSYSAPRASASSHAAPRISSGSSFSSRSSGSSFRSSGSSGSGSSFRSSGGGSSFRSSGSSSGGRSGGRR